jgi:hypothetical protein
VNPRGRRRNPVPPPVRRAGKAAVRAYALATAWMRPLPDYLVVGAKRSGTTSMSRYLLEHPHVLPLFPSASRFPMADDMKGVRYFDNGFTHPPRWYRSWFPTTNARRRREGEVGAPVVAGEATPYYLFHPLAATRARSVVPDAKVLVLLRDPVERAYSHWKEQRRNGLERLGFDAAVDAEADRLAGEEERIVAEAGYRSFAHEHQSYVAQGEYSRGLRRWFDAFGRERVLVLVSEELYADPQAAFASVCRFFGLPPHELRAPDAWNVARAEQAMSASTRDALACRYAADRPVLEELLGRPLPWPRPAP